MTTNLQKSNRNTLPLEKISSTRDLLKAKPMQVHAKSTENSILLLYTEIRISAEKCAMSLGIDMSEAKMAILAKDIYEVHKYDSLEDIRECFKKARQGRFNFSFYSRSVISMPLFNHWMSQHLEEKAQERERILSERKKIEDSEYVPSEKSQFYLNQIKEHIRKVRELKASEKPVFTFENASNYWINELKKHRGHRLVYRLITNKIDKGQDLSDNEKEWLDAWNISYSSK